MVFLFTCANNINQTECKTIKFLDKISKYIHKKIIYLSVSFAMLILCFLVSIKPPIVKNRQYFNVITYFSVPIILILVILVTNLIYIYRNSFAILIFIPFFLIACQLVVLPIKEKKYIPTTQIYLLLATILFVPLFLSVILYMFNIHFILVIIFVVISMIIIGFIFELLIDKISKNFTKEIQNNMIGYEGYINNIINKSNH